MKNILILTPDGVGSTILQRLCTMALYLENVSVINTHELTNGLELNQDNKLFKNSDIGYGQSLKEITDIISNSDKNTMLVSRLAKYHLDNRQDRDEERIVFYNFLNNYFNKKIKCVRKNIFEYAMSWSIRQKTSVLNIYDRIDQQKVLEISSVDEDYFLKKCNQYVEYIQWTYKNFPDAETVSYEDMITKTDKLLDNLTGFQNTFVKKFGSMLSVILRAEYNYFHKKNPLDKKETKALYQYKNLSNSLMYKGIILGQPIKNSSLQDKKDRIKNFDRCLKKFYNFAKNHNWIDQSTATYDFWNDRNIC
jgi:hypothetical protein